jgi:YebC/PmpR family DNA-binding regulatory protein
MSGHSHWATIKRSKGAADAKRGQLFTKIGREIEIAAREGGPDLTANFRLRLCVDKARQAAMPKENIERAILRGTGQLKGETIEQMSYEGYGPQGTAMIVDVMTDNRNRAVSEVRRVFTRHGGNLAETGAVSWMFERKGYISITPENGDADELALMAIDAGADDVKTSQDLVEVYTKVDDLQKIKGALEASEVSFESAELTWVPKTMLQLDNKATVQVLKMIDALEELDDVQQVSTNLDITDTALAAYEEEQ